MKNIWLDYKNKYEHFSGGKENRLVLWGLKLYNKN